MTGNVKATVAAVAAAVLVFVLAVMFTRSDEAPSASGDGAVAAAEQLVRPDSHRLSQAPPGAPVFVEFLDFECESCRAVYPAVEQLRTEYGDRISFVVRYFPIPSHANAENAAVAVEAAAQQGRFEQMYQRMYETQASWGEQQESRAHVFRGFAVDLGLDMAAYDRAVADPATLARVVADRNDGVAAGVTGTPTFFLDGTRITPRSIEDLRTAFDGALAR